MTRDHRHEIAMDVVRLGPSPSPSAIADAIMPRLLDAGAEVARLTRERDAALEALRLEMWREHVPCTGTQHDPINGLIHGFCVRCRTPWPCEWCPESTIQSIETGAIHNDQ